MRWHEIFERFRERHPTPGLAYAIVRDGEVLYQGEAGVASRNPERAVSVLTRFRIASMTKSFAAAVAFALVMRACLSFLPLLARFCRIWNFRTHCVHFPSPGSYR